MYRGLGGVKGQCNGRGFYFVLWEINSKCRDCVCSSEVLSFYFHWFCSTDMSFGFVGLMFKRQQYDSL